jgi:hypothetical protein
MLIKTNLKTYHYYLKTAKRQYIYSSIECNDTGLKKLSQALSEQTSDSSDFVNAKLSLKICTQV